MHTASRAATRLLAAAALAAGALAAAGPASAQSPHARPAVHKAVAKVKRDPRLTALVAQVDREVALRTKQLERVAAAGTSARAGLTDAHRAALLARVAADKFALASARTAVHAAATYDAARRAAAPLAVVGRYLEARLSLLSALDRAAAPARAADAAVAEARTTIAEQVAVGKDGSAASSAAAALGTAASAILVNVDKQVSGLLAAPDADAPRFSRAKASAAKTIGDTARACSRLSPLNTQLSAAVQALLAAPAPAPAGDAAPISDGT